MRLAAEPPPRGTTATINSLARLTQGSARPNMGGRGVEQRQLVGLITRRSEVRILPPQPIRIYLNPGPRPPGVRPSPDYSQRNVRMARAEAPIAQTARSTSGG